MKHLALITLLILTLSAPAHAGYTVHVEQLQAEFVNVNGPEGPQVWQNNEHSTIKPATYGAELCRPDNYSVFSIDAARRSKVFYDTAGSATDAQVFAVCSGLKDQRRVQIRTEGDRRLKALANPYLGGERETWPVQMAEAEKCLNDSEACTEGPGKNPASFVPMVAQMAQARGITILDLVGKIWENVMLFRQYSGAILGAQQRLLDEIDAATTVAGLLAIGWGN